MNEQLWNTYLALLAEAQHHEAIPRLCVACWYVTTVAALLQRGLSTVLGNLAACGYDAEWEVLSAAAFGAPHLRERVFLVAYPAQQQFNASQKSPSHSESSQTASAQRSHCDVAHANSHRSQAIYAQPGLLQEAQSTRGLQSADGNRAVFCQSISRRDVWANEPAVGRVAHGIPARVDRLRGLGNAVVPQVAEYIGRCILADYASSAGRLVQA